MKPLKMLYEEFLKGYVKKKYKSYLKNSKILSEGFINNVYFLIYEEREKDNHKWLEDF